MGSNANTTINLILALLFLGANLAWAQSSCDPSTPSFTVDLSVNEDSVWTSPAVSREGNCCSTSNPDRCIEFVVTLAPQATGLNFFISSGANPTGSLFYQIDCGPAQPVGTGVCLRGDSTYRLTFCKPGNNQNQYSIQSINGISSKPLTVGEGCSGVLSVSGLTDSTISWNSIYPGSAGDYNGQLDCLQGCDTVQFTANSGNPDTIWYEVRGVSAANCSPNDTLVDTLVVIMFPAPQLDSSQINYNCATGRYDVEFHVTGPDGGFLYSIDGGQNRQVDSAFAGLSPGSYAVQFINQSGCKTDTSLQLRTPSALSIDSIYRDPPSCGQANGQIEIYASGEPPFRYRLNGGPWQTDSSFSGLGPGSYSIQVEDSLGCLTSSSLSLSNQAAPVIAIDQINNPSCNNSDGSIQVSANGSAPPYLFNIHQAGAGGPFNYQSDSLFQNLSAGSYTLVVMDTNGCLDSMDYQLTDVNGLVISSIQSSAPGCNQSNGSIAIFTTGGQAPLQFSLDGGATFQSSNNFQSLSAGVYQIRVQDNQGCFRDQSFALNEPNGPSVDLVESTPTNCGLNNGSFRIYASGGIPPYAFSINGGQSFDSTSIYSNMPPGTYPLEIVDQDSCRAYDTVLIQALPVPQFNQIQLAAASCDAVGGSIQISAIGTQPLLFSINAGNTYTTDSIFTNLSPGSYTLSIQDSAGCEIDSLVWIENLNLGQIDGVSPSHETCSNQNGRISIDPSGNGMGLSFSIDGGLTYQSDSVFTGLSAGNYSVIVLHTSGCSDTNQITLVDLEAPFIWSIGITPANCGQDNGQASANATGGSPPYMYNFNQQGFQAQNTMGNLGAGTHMVIVQDTNGCTDTTQFSVGRLPELQIQNVLAVQPTCEQSNGSIQIQAQGGQAPFQFSIDGGLNFQPDSLFTNLGPGTYFIKVTDDAGCQSDTNLVLSNLASPVLDSLNLVHSFCTTSNGSATVHVSGNGPFTYALNGGASQLSNQFNGLAPGNYSIQFTDTNGCQTSTAFTISADGSPEISAIPTNDATCNESNGTALIQANSGMSPYLYELNGGGFQTDSNFVNLSPGTYMATVQDQNGCTASSSFTISSVSAPSLGLQSSQSAGCGQNNGSLQVSVSGGVSPFQYAINGGGFGGSPNFSNLAGGSYEIVVEDANGCRDTLNHFLPTLADLDFIQFDLTHARCDENNGQVRSQVNGGQAGYSYTLQGVAGPKSNGNFSNLVPGVYTLTVVDSRGCQIDSSFSIQQMGSPGIDSLVIQGDTCGRNVGFIQVFAQGGNLEFSLNSNVYQSDSSFSGLSGGSYLITVKDSNGCLIDTSISLPSLAGPTIDSVVVAPTTCGLPNGSILVYGSGGAPPYIYSFDDGISFQNDSLFSPAPSGTYDIVVVDLNGCEVRTSVIVSAEPAPFIDSVFIGPSFCLGSNGSIEIFALSGEPAYSYSLDGTSFQGSNTFSGLVAGNYMAYLKDNRGCLDSIPFTIDSIPMLKFNGVHSSNPICNQTNGELDVSIMQGSAPFQFSIDGGISFGPDSVFTNLAAGAYNVLVEDARGCQIDTGITLIQQGLPNLDNLRLRREDCNQSNGEVEATVTGNGPFTFTLNGNSQGSGLFSGLPQGNYTLRILDQNGCQIDTTFLLRTLNGPIVDSIQVDSSRCQKTNGQLEVFVSGGTPPFSYSIDSGSTFQASQNFSNLGPGFYYLVVEDGAGCLAYDSLQVDSIPGLVMTGANPISASCGQANGLVQIFTQGGRAPLQYGIQLSAMGLSNQIQNLSPGIYTAYVQDALGCMDSLPFTISEIPAPNWNRVYFGHATCDASNGFIQVSSQFGLRPISYQINGGGYASDSLFNNLNPGLYLIEAVDASGCTFDTTFQINQNGSPALSVLFVQDEQCNQGNGSLEVNGSGNGPFQYQLNGGPLQASGLFSNLSAGSHSIRVLDTSNCFVDTVIGLNDVSGPTLSLFAQSQPSCGQNNGTVQLSATGGNGFYSYAIDTLPYQPQTLFTGIGPGNHVAYVKDLAGCIDSIGFIFNDKSGPEFALIQPIYQCGTQSYNLILTPFGGNQPVKYSINGGLSHQSDSIFLALSPGTYALQLKDALGCLVDSTVLLPSIQALSLDSLQRDPPACGRSDGSISVFATGPRPLKYSLDQTNWQQSGTFKNLGPGSYSVFVKDSVGCVESLSFSLSNTPPPNLNIISLQNPTCGKSNGQVTLSGAGAAAPFTYAIDTGSGQSSFKSDSVFSNLSAGNIIVYVLDSNGCSNNFSISLLEVNNMVINSIVGKSPDCDQNNGSIAFTSSGGTQPHVYSVDSGLNFQSTPTFNNLSSGTYTLVVQDVNGCNRIQPYTLSKALGPSIDLIETKATTCGIASGKIEFFVSGGKAPYAYSVDGGISFQSSPVFTGLNPGLYPLVARDQKLCEVMDTVLVDSISPPNLDSLAVSAASCLAVGGSISLYAQGSPPLQYSINGGQSFQSSPTFQNLNSGSYAIQIMDSAGCLIDTNTLVPFEDFGRIVSLSILPDTCLRGVGSIFVHISGDSSGVGYRVNNGAWQSSPLFRGLNQGPFNVETSHPSGCSDLSNGLVPNLSGPQIDSIHSAPVRCGQTNGYAQVFASGGQGSLSYQLNQGPWTSSNSWAGLNSGQYTVKVRDGYACPDSISFTIDSIAPLSIDLSQFAHATCDSLNGSIQVLGGGGFPPYGFSIDLGMTWQSNPHFSGLTPGKYSLMIRDSSFCTQEDSLRLVQLSGPSFLSVQAVNPFCGQVNGQIQVHGEGNGYVFYLNGVGKGQDTLFDNLGSGNFLVEIIDTNGCIQDSLIQLLPLDGPTIDSIRLVNLSCGQLNGEIQVFASGGQGPFMFSIDSSVSQQASPFFTNLDSGVYTVQVTDTNGCTDVRTISLNVLPPVRLDSVQASETYCSQNNASVVLIHGGGKSPYQFALDQSGFGFSNTFSGLNAGGHWGFVRDGNGCMDSLYFTIKDRPAPFIDTLTMWPTACGNDFGRISVRAKGQARPFQYSLNGSPFQTDSSFTGLGPGWHYVLIQDSNQCQQTDSVEVIELNPPDLQPASQFQASCLDTNGSILVHASGNGNLMYSINSGPWQVDSSFGPLSTGSYLIQVLDSNGCVGQQTVQLGSDYQLYENLAITPPGTGCLPYEASFGFSGLTGADSCSWVLGDGTVVQTCDPFTHTYSQAGCYDVDLFIRTKNGCFGDTTFLDHICINPSSEAKFRSFPETLVEALEPIQVQNYSSNADQVSWFIDGVFASAEWEPVLKIKAQPGDSLAIICLVTETNLGCPDTTCKTYRLDQKFRWFIANAFTPNGDGENEGFKPIFLNDPQDAYLFGIYDRWGELVYETNSPLDAWDGIDRLHGAERPKQDVYAWKIRFRNPISGELVKATGRVTLLL